MMKGVLKVNDAQIFFLQCLEKIRENENKNKKKKEVVIYKNTTEN